ncbi:disulfide bond formation protein DsbA [Candidatus Saccharibacteria bacterium]|nr:MAG: disulfide bond formation protein DsbA [Candidatus Saccharibacteria bacterium]
MDKRFLAILGVILLAFGGIVMANHKSADTSGNAKGDTPAQTTNHLAGKLDSDVVLVEYGDYQCPACKSFYPVTKQVKEKYADRVRYQFRNLPLVSLHPNAFAGARAAEAAALQDKFWEMHDLLYENQDPRGASGWVASKDPLSDYFVGFAKQLGLDTAKFRTDFASGIVNKRINADFDSFKETGEQMSTPTFFINGKRVDGVRLAGSDGRPSVESFSRVLDEALANAKSE